MFQWLLGWVCWWPQFFIPIFTLYHRFCKLFIMRIIYLSIPWYWVQSCDWLWTMDTSTCDTKRDLKNFLYVQLILLCLATTERTCLDKPSGGWKTNGWATQVIPAKNTLVMSWPSWFPRHVSRPGQDQEERHVVDSQLTTGTWARPAEISN